MIHAQGFRRRPAGTRAAGGLRRVASGLASLLLAAGAHAQDAATIAREGVGQAVACASCHGPDGRGQGAFPRLAGLDADYLHKQLQDFGNGSRQNAVMKPIVAALTPEQLRGMAEWYAGLPAGAPASAGTPAPALGERIALRGAWDRKVPACVQCHGPGGRGVGSAFPAIASQPAAYIEAQLAAWRDGTRANDPLELMRHLAGELTAAEIKAVAQWFASRPATGAAR